MSILLFFIKKMKENKMRMVVYAGMFSLGMFLSCFCITLCYNFSNNVDSMFADNKSRLLISVNATDNFDISAVNLRDISSQMAIRTSDLLVKEIDSNAMKISVCEIAGGEETSFLSDYIIEGNSDINNDSILIKKDIIDKCNLNLSNIIGKKVRLSDGTSCNIIGIYDDYDVFLPDCLILGRSSRIIPETYLVKAVNIRSVPKIVSSFEKAGFTVQSHNNEIKDLIESAEIFSSVITLFMFFSFVFGVVVFYSIIINTIRDMYPFIAMIKAIGYRKKECLMLILANSLYVIYISAIMILLLYFIGMPCICKIFKFVNIFTIYNISVTVLFKSVLIIPLAELAIAFIGMIVADLISLNKIQKMHVSEMLCEVNQ